MGEDGAFDDGRNGSFLFLGVFGVFEMEFATYRDWYNFAGFVLRSTLRRMRLFKSHTHSICNNSFWFVFIYESLSRLRLKILSAL
jgi:hypothetical protein